MGDAGSWKLQFKVPQKKGGNKTNLRNEAPYEMPNESLLLRSWGGQGEGSRRGWAYQTKEDMLILH